MLEKLGHRAFPADAVLHRKALARCTHPHQTGSRAGSTRFVHPFTSATIKRVNCPRRMSWQFSGGATRIKATDDFNQGVPQLPSSPGPVLVWFKHDLRLTDHPGLLAAVEAGSPIIPFFCLDAQLFAHLSLTPAGPEGLLAALTQLRRQLQAVGSELVFRVGPSANTAAAVAAQAAAGRIVMEREEESRWLEAGHRLALQLESLGLPTRITTWQAPLWQQTVFKLNFKQWAAARGRPLPPLPAPTALSPLPAGLDPGALPDVSQLKQLLADALISSADSDRWAAEKAAGRTEVLQYMLTEPGRQSHSEAVQTVVQAYANGEVTAQQLLEAYLSADGITPSCQQLTFLKQAVAELETPAAVGASFPALLGPLVSLGVMSSRQVYATTVSTESRRWGGRLPITGPSTATAKAALAAMELSDFHRQLAGHIPQEGDENPQADISSKASKARANGQQVSGPVASASSSFDEGSEGVAQWGVVDWPAGLPRRCNWRWRGALTDYCVVEPVNPKPGLPPLVLVHGFGAFGDQWRFNLAPLAEAGYRVYAPTLPGFGRSEKAALQYSQNAWRDFIRDFLVCVVGEPAVIAGNSIGGFICTSTAADYPSLVAGLALINSAGPITPGVTKADVDAAAAVIKKPPPAWVVRLTTFGLMMYLQNSIGKQLKWLYPTNPAHADEWLEQEIYRAACDSRSADVFASVFYLPKPRPLNFLINQLWQGPTAVVQGVLDPLNDAKGRADLLQQTCGRYLRVWEVQAGHCPHDEQPAAVNAALLEFVEQMVLPQRKEGSTTPAVAATATATS